MGSADERKVSLNTQKSDLGGGKDLLYGWLVGRAAADLGLAQALAASEAQRSEQIKRLEAALLTEIRELENRQALSANAAGSAAQIDALKEEMQRFSERQNQLETARVSVEGLEAAIRAKLGEFESQIHENSSHLAPGNLDDFEFEIKLLADRIARAEFCNQQAQARAASESQRVQEQVSTLIKSQAAAIKAQIIEELRAHPPSELAARTVAEALQEKIDELRSEIGREAPAAGQLVALRDDLDQLALRLSQIESVSSPPPAIANELSRWNDDHAVKTLENIIGSRIDQLQDKLTRALNAIDNRDTEIRGLNVQLADLTDKVAELTSRAADHGIGEAERLELMRSFEKLVSAQTLEVENRLNEILKPPERNAIGQFQIEMSALVNRVAQIELASQEAHGLNSAAAERAQKDAEGLRAELALLRVELSQQNAEPAPHLIQKLEETVSAKIGELRSHFALEQQSGQGRDALLSEIRSEMQLMVQRLVQAESSAQQTHALMVNEAAQTGQLRDSMIGELTALQTQLAERRTRDAEIDGLARELKGRVFEIQSQLSQKLSLLASRDEEFAELKLEVQNLMQLSAQKPAAPPAAVNRLHAPLGATVGLSSPKAQPDAMSAFSPPANEPNSLMQSYDAESEAPKDQKKQLQQRMSADIERARAELRKRAGVGR